jgi:hypothetical protein
MKDCIINNEPYLRKYKEMFKEQHEQSQFDLSSEDSFVEDVRVMTNSRNSNLSQGIIAINGRQTIKFLHPDHVEGIKLRGNQPSVLYRYIELQQAGESVYTMKKYTSLYPEHFNDICHFSSVLQDIIDNVFRKYRNRFVRKMVSIAPPEQYYIIRELHEQYLQDKTNIVTPERVSEYIRSLPPQRIMTLYKSFIQREQINGHGNKINEDHYNKVETLIYNKKE